MNNVVKLHPRADSPEWIFYTVIEILVKNGNTRLAEVLKKEKEKTPTDVFTKILRVIEEYLEIMHEKNNFPQAIRSILGQNSIHAHLSANNDSFKQEEQKVA